MARFFINTGDGIEYRNTEDEARTLALESLEFWRKDARKNGEWGDEADSVYWGQVIETSNLIQCGNGSDYELMRQK